MGDAPDAEDDLLLAAGSRSVEELAECIGLAIARVVAAVQAAGGEDDDQATDTLVRRWLFGLELRQRTQCLALALSQRWPGRSAEVASAVRHNAPWSPEPEPEPEPAGALCQRGRFV